MDKGLAGARATPAPTLVPPQALMEDPRQVASHPTPVELAEAESSLLVHLELYAWLGDKARMADAYRDLGVLYRGLGDPAAGSAMDGEAGKLDEPVGGE
jgi:hypothetical protein